MPADEAAFDRAPSNPGWAEAADTEDAPPGPRSLWEAPGLWLGLLLALGLAVPFVPVPNQATAYVAGAAFLLLHALAVVCFVAFSTRRRMSLTQHVVCFALVLGLWAALQFGATPAVDRMFDHLKAAHATPTLAHHLAHYAVSTLTDLALLGAAVLGGGLVAQLIGSPNLLGPVCIIIALIDVWGVLFGGIVSQLLEKAPDVAGKAMAKVPAVGAAHGATVRFHVPQLQVGAGDYLFLGLLFAALHLHRMNWRGAMRLVTPLVILGLLIVAFTGIPMPGLLFIGLGVAIPNRQYFEYTREEKFAVFYAAIFVVILTGALYFGITSQLPETPGH